MFALSAGCIFLQLLTLGAVSQEERTSIETLYRNVSTAMQAKDIAAITAMGYRTFPATADSLAATWENSFQSVEAYDSIEFSLHNLASIEGDVVATVERRIFFHSPGDPTTQHVEQGRSRDRWTPQRGTWRLIDREEVGPTMQGDVLPAPRPLSPCLQQLQAAVQRGEPEAVAAFWAKVTGKCPIVEPWEDQPQHRLVTFLWRDDGSTDRVEVRGGPYESSRDHFVHLEGTDIWYHSERLPVDARYVYGLIVRKRVIQSAAEGGDQQEVLVETYPVDPCNSVVFNGGPVVELPDAPSDSWHVPRAAVAQGSVEARSIDSKALQETRAVRVYRSPVTADNRQPQALAVFLDGEDCANLMSLPTVLDNLVAAGRIPPLVAVMVDSQGTRGRDLLFHEPFVSFLADELVPWASQRYGTTFAAKQTMVGGMSLGGLTAAYAAYRRPDVFGNVLSQSGAFWRTHPTQSNLPEGWFPGEVARAPAPPVRFYLEVGRFEAPGMVENNRRLRDVLIAKGCDVTYAEYHGGHDHVNWRVSVGNGITALLGK